MARISCLLLAAVVVATTAAAAAAGGGGSVLDKPISALRPDVVVDKAGGGGAVTTVGEALQRLERRVKGAAEYFIIYIKQGIYDEHLVIEAPKVVLIGDGMEKTIITGSLCNKTGQTLHESATLSKNPAA
jgi:pectinesterase